ncbi:DsbA family oxidoreductase [Saliterribacillus persicus]|uniref:Putative DsbA family dithiol-disulfide isomerase n=1 Tax=Saliterribacillus persicus TaxID=930114 RepID=A0A368XWZ2_9BACI|nr:DsbA family oxidoreductase [Saliterribacillus persicus]RCW71999.1 putative DsbA family dithiol-disulfide isomerase [Saliterribacillus persicus]
MEIEIWSDFVCPFCYIGKKQFELALDKFKYKDAVNVTFKSFELDPNANEYDGKSIHQVLASKFNSSVDHAKKTNLQVENKAKLIHLPINTDIIKPTNSFDAHRLQKYAQTQNKELAATDAIFKAYFSEGKIISEPDTLRKIALDIDLDASVSDELVENKQKFAKEVREDEELAKQYQITGVPFFIFNQKYAVSGAQTVETFLAAMEEVWEEDHEEWKDPTHKKNYCVGEYCDGENCDDES